MVFFGYYQLEIMINEHLQLFYIQMLTKRIKVHAKQVGSRIIITTKDNSAVKVTNISNVVLDFEDKLEYVGYPGRNIKNRLWFAKNLIYQMLRSCSD